jgi:RNA-binding protein NOB1
MAVNPTMEQPTLDTAAQPQPEAAQNPAPTMSETVESAHTSSPAAQTTTPLKHVHSLVIDANAIIRNDPTLSTLLAQAEELYTIPAVVSESTPTMPLYRAISY